MNRQNMTQDLSVWFDGKMERLLDNSFLQERLTLFFEGLLTKLEYDELEALWLDNCCASGMENIEKQSNR